MHLFAPEVSKFKAPVGSFVRLSAANEKNPTALFFGPFPGSSPNNAIPFDKGIVQMGLRSTELFLFAFC